MSEEEFRRLMEAARRPARSGAGEDTAGEDTGREQDEEDDRDDRAQEDQP
jgi:hypothetical protein